MLGSNVASAVGLTFGAGPATIAAAQAPETATSATLPPSCVSETTSAVVDADVSKRSIPASGSVASSKLPGSASQRIDPACVTENGLRPGQLADLLDKTERAVRSILYRMLKDGQVNLVDRGLYTARS